MMTVSIGLNLLINQAVMTSLQFIRYQPLNTTDFSNCSVDGGRRAAKSIHFIVQSYTFRTLTDF